MYDDQDDDKKKKKGVKGTVNAADGARRRANMGVSLREEQRERELEKRRNKDGSTQHATLDPNAAADPFSFDSKTDPEDIPVTLLPTFVKMATDTQNERNVLQGCLMIRKLLSVERNPPIDQIIETQIVPKLVEYLGRHDNVDLQFEAAWALTNIASGTQQHTHYVMQLNAAPIFVQLLSSPSEDLREQATWAIGNMAGDSSTCRDYILGLKVIDPLIMCMTAQTTKTSVTRNAVWALSNLCRSKPQPDIELVAPALPALAHLLNHDEPEVITDACWAISYISDGNPDRVQYVLNANIVPRMVQILGSPATQMVTPAIRTIGNVCTGNDVQTQPVINCGALPAFHLLLNHPKRSVRKETCWTISNITAGSVDQIQAVINAGLITPLIKCCGASEFEVKKEAVWAIANATSGGTSAQIETLVQTGILAPMCEMLTLYDVKTVSVALEAIENVLSVGDDDKKEKALATNPYADLLISTRGLDAIEALQTHNNNEIYTQAMSILEGFFDLESATTGAPVSEVAPPVTTQESGFGFNEQQGQNPQGQGGAGTGGNFTW